MAIKGLNNVLKRLEKLGEEVAEDVHIITLDVATQIELDAKNNAPKNVGKLTQSIEAIELGKANYKVVVKSSYGAYVEFGTAGKVRVPAEMQSIASQFQQKGKGSFEQGLQAIKDWCKQKGIDESAAYPIFVSILNKGIEAQPFLYPAFVKGRQQYLKDLKQLLKDKTK